MAASRRAFTLIEILVAMGIVGILTGIAVPAAMAVRRATVARSALVAIRAVDLAVTTSCGRGSCGPYGSSASAQVLKTVPQVLKEFLPAGFVFARDTATYALQLETWTIAPVRVAPCKGRGSKKCPPVQVPIVDPAFTNTSGVAAASLVYVTVVVITRDGNVAQALYNKAGGSPPVFIVRPVKVWKYSYPVLVAAPSTG